MKSAGGDIESVARARILDSVCPGTLAARSSLWACVVAVLARSDTGVGPFHTRESVFSIRPVLKETTVYTVLRGPLFFEQLETLRNWLAG